MTARFARAPTQARAAPRARHARASARARPRPESLADAAAAAVLGGRTGVARDVGQAPPATARVAGSPGAPLAPGLRGRLERGFGADLAAVRVHTDTSAREAVRAASARGFAAGPDVYLDLPAHALESDTGLQLLAHEVAHVLQQTARPGSDGRPAATRMVGWGAVQCAGDDALEAAKKNKMFDSAPTYDQVKERYLAGHETDSELLTAVRLMDALVGSGFQKGHPNAKAIVALTAVAKTPANDHVSAFHFDCLKGIEEWEAARPFLDRHGRRLVSSWMSLPFYEHYRKKSPEHVALAATQTPALRSVFPDAFVAGVRAYLLTGTYPAFATEAKQVVAAINARDAALPPNEVVLMAHFGLYVLFPHARDWLAGIWKKLEKAGAKGLLWHKLSNIAAWLQTGTPSDGRLHIQSSPEEAALLAAAWPQLQAMARQVHTYWGSVSALRHALDFSREALGRTPAQVVALAKKAKTQPALAGLDTALRGATAGLFATPKGALPTPDAYDGAVELTQQALQALIDSYDPALIQAAAATTDAALQLGLVVADLYGLKTLLGEYSHERDIKLVDEEQSPDERVASRLATAKRLQELGERYDLPALTKLATDALGARSTLALNGEWQETEIGFKEVSAIPGGGFRGIAKGGVTFNLQALWMYSLYYQALSDALEALLTTGEGDYSAFSKSHRPLLEQALEQTKHVGRPRLFRMTRYEYRYVQPTKLEGGKQVPDPDKTFGDLVYAHERMLRLLALGRPGEIWVTPHDPPPRKDVGIRVWFLPDTDKLVARLKDIPKLDERVKAAWKANPANAGRTLADGDWFEWLLALGQLAGTLKKKSVPGVMEATAIAGDVTSVVTEAHARARKRFVPLARRATTHDRIVWTNTVIRPLLNEYDRFDLTTNHKVTDAFMEMGRFARGVQPESDRTVQMAVLVFDVATSLAAAVGGKEVTFGRTGADPRRDVVGMALPLVEGALAVYDDVRTRLVMEEIRGNVTSAELGSMAATLRVLRDELIVPVKEVQAQNAVVGDPDNNQLYLQNFKGYKAKDGFDIYGVEYKIVQITRPFYYEPTYQWLHPMGVEWPGPLTGRSRLWVKNDAGFFVESPRTSEVPLLRIVVTSGNTTQEWDMTERRGESERRLDRVASQLGDWAGFEHLRNTGALIEFIATLGIEVLELIPGIGQGVTAGKFVLVILDEIATGRVEKAIELFGENGVKEIRKRLDELAGQFDLGFVLRWLLFQEAEAIHQRITPKRTTPNKEQKELLTRGGPWARLGRALENVLHIGVRFVESLIRTKKRVAAPFRRAQLFVLSHPFAAMAVEFIGSNWDRLAALDLGELIDPAQEKADPGVRGRMAEGVKDGIQGVADGAFEGIEKVRTLELPHEILPVEVVLDFLIDFAVSQLGLKYKKGLQAVRAALEKLGQWKHVISKVAGWVKRYIGDPNDLWRKAVDELFRPKLERLRKDFVDVLFDTFLRVPFLKGTLQRRTGAPIKELEFAGTDFPDARPYPAPAFFGAGDPGLFAQDEGGLPAPGGGDPLPGVTRANAELGFGHDFRHVRLHRGGDASRVTRAFRAEAVTTGSHVYLRPDLSPESGFGQKVLRHELAHVIQQAGPRPLGATPAPDPRPVTGEARRGLTYDPAAESAAHRAASGAEAGARPLDLGGRVRGLQPGIFSAEVIRELLAELRKFDTLRAFEKKVDEERAKIAISKFHGDPLSKEAGLFLPDKLKTLVQAIPVGNLEKPFGHARALIVDAFNTFAGDDVAYKKAIWAVIDETRSSETPDKKAKLDKSLYPYLPPGALQVNLEQYIYAKTGVAYHFKLPTTAGGPEVRGKPVLNFKAGVAEWQVHVRYVHLPGIRDKAAAAPLWKEAVKKTFPTEKDQNLWIKVAQLVLLRLGPRPDIWLKDEFRFTSATEKRIVSQADDIAEILTKPWPTPKQYAETNVAALKDDKGPKGPVPGGKVKSLGLRIGTFKEWGAGSGQTHPDRNAHHITQFLLLKYFSNAQSSYKPFPHLRKTQLERYPGVDAADPEQVTTIQGDGAKKPIQVHKYSGRIDARGPGMPTILITRLTHMAGIHFRSEEADEDGTGRASQGAATHNVFTAELGKLWPVLDKPKDLDALKGESDAKKKKLPESGVTTSKKELREGIFTAAVKTYQMMRDDMQVKLLRGLKEQETDYYNAISELNKGKPLTESEKLQPGAMDKVHDAAKKANEILETDGGFQGP